MKRNIPANPPQEAPSPRTGGRLRLWVDRADGTTGELPEGEFRSGAGRLLFVRRGQCIEIRCPRSKDLFRIHFSHEPSCGTTQDADFPAVMTTACNPSRPEVAEPGALQQNKHTPNYMKVSNRILATRMARRYHQQGLTLIELLVVLVILIALAGILTPQLPSMLTRAHTATCSTNIPEQNKRIQEFEQIYFKQPANFDNLVNGTALVDYLPSDGTPVGGHLTATALTAGTRAALFNAGITSIAGLYDTSANLTAANGTPTVNPYDATADLDLSTGTPSVAVATESVIESLIRPDSGTDVYVALGVGQKSELIGRVMSDAPIHFGDTPSESPSSVYTRFVAIYKVSNDGTALEKAQFIGVLAPHGDGLDNAAAHIEEFYSANQL